MNPRSDRTGRQKHPGLPQNVSPRRPRAVFFLPTDAATASVRNIDGENGEDLIDGGADSDEVSGGNGKDTVYGSNGDDDLFGDNGMDHLDGGDGVDIGDGGNGKDTCIDLETTLSC